jgi:DNA-binding response OmpR family regulator
MTNEEMAQNASIRILIADDDPPTRMLLKAAISQWGYQTLEAGDGEEAWQLIQNENTPHLLILDWLMPKLDGIQLCFRIKDQTLKRPYIILLTQLSGSANIIKGLEAGADEFLSKPFNTAELRSRINVGVRIIKLTQELEKLQNKANLNN